ncbi:Rieske (2Fe-2S) protein [Terasakiispira papahanaumokuakeensis]|uniref:Rieske (2Fe-2S) protein n=1 Tax=Terasakiispira papahanaumokuakeensis TaxID=197479 RepID=UPI0009FBE88D|nr:Rieske 2Fe-2S domain-containing protein [Terasakiispira papahanaumokuakeensis]
MRDSKNRVGLPIPTLGEKRPAATTLEIDGHAIILVRLKHHWRAYLNQCPHRGIPLDWTPGQVLDQSGQLLLCAMHGALFHPENGHCLAGPCQGKALVAIDIEVTQNRLWLSLPSPERSA